MPQLENAPERNYPAGQFASGNLALPEGTRELVITLSAIETWPDVSDGTIVMSLLISRGSGNPFVREWKDGPFEHKAVYRLGVKQTALRLGAVLQAPFGASDRVRYEFDSTVAFRAAVALDANISGAV